MIRDIEKLEELARKVRWDVVDMIYRSKDGHPAPALGVADIITALYFGVMNIDPRDEKKPDRDRLILSKGHACPAQYAALAGLGYFSRDVYPTLRCFGSILQGHPCMKKTPGIDMTSGSLGNGIPIGLGMELARQRTGGSWYTYVITGDGELNEGVAWEGVMSAVKNKAENLVVFVDNNGHQSGGHVSEVSGIEPLACKWKAFGWHVQEIDGNDIRQILDAVKCAKAVKGTPSVIIAATIKGKGVSYMEGNNDWHKGTPTEEQWRIASKELGGDAQ